MTKDNSNENCNTVTHQLHFTIALPIYYYDEQGDGIMLKVSKCAPSFLPFLPSSTWKLAKSIFPAPPPEDKFWQGRLVQCSDNPHIYGVFRCMVSYWLVQLSNQL